MLLLHYIFNLCNDPSVQPRLTFTDWSVVAPGSKDLSYSLAANGLTALKNIVFSATELHHAANAAHNHTQLRSIWSLEKHHKFENMSENRSVLVGSSVAFT